eukprot:1191679-Prorocentrum_minimum.AAC.1
MLLLPLLSLSLSLSLSLFSHLPQSPFTTAPSPQRQLRLHGVITARPTRGAPLVGELDLVRAIAHEQLRRPPRGEGLHYRLEDPKAHHRPQRRIIALPPPPGPPPALACHITPYGGTQGVDEHAQGGGCARAGVDSPAQGWISSPSLWPAGIAGWRGRSQAESDSAPAPAGVASTECIPSTSMLSAPRPPTRPPPKEREPFALGSSLII